MFSNSTQSFIFSISFILVWVMVEILVVRRKYTLGWDDSLSLGDMRRIDFFFEETQRT